ncbi:MAG: MMPL family transporter [Clostridiales Family XIII bacterium]|jgi:predicted RND superfamily exporter protein|nr:MMPL family transporter [Clostridiales Family XIII bacterium]
MDFLLRKLIQHKKLVTMLFLATALIGLCMWPFIKVNYNIVDYLPANAPSTEAIATMEKEFTATVANARVMVKNVTINEALAYKEKLKEIPSLSSVTWLDDVVDIRIPLEVQDKALVETYYKDGNALLSMTIKKGDEISTIDSIYELLGNDGSVSGQAVTYYTAQKMSGSETKKAMFIVVPLILLLLILSTSSWIEPILYLFAIAIAIFINMGSNLLLGEISFITSSVSPIMQLAVSLDYAIFLLHSFQTYRKETSDVSLAMRKAMKRALPTVAASAFTTIFGFGALCFMDFRVGFDMGLNLVKGVCLSLLCASIFLPAFTLCCYKFIDRTKHKPILSPMQGVGRPLLKVGIPFIIIIMILVVPSFLGQARNNFLYGMGDLAPGTRAGVDKEIIEDVFGKSMPLVILVPRGEPGTELLLSNELAELPHITSVISYAKTVGSAIPPELLEKDQHDQFYSEHYARIILYADVPDEGDEAFALVEKIRETCSKYYDTTYSTGESITLYDVKNVVVSDNRITTIIALVSIAFVLLLMFRSLTLPILLLLTIETSIWISMSYSYFFNSPLSYIGYLIVSAVQLGATVDYAILYTDHYLKERQLKPKKQAARDALGSSFRSILISAAVLISAGGSMWLTSTNGIVSALGMLIARGTLLSFALTTCFLPTMLIVLDRWIRVTTLRANFFTGTVKKENHIR